MRVQQTFITSVYFYADEVKEILRLAVVEDEKTLSNIVDMIDKSFSHLGNFELEEISREPMRPTPTFE